MNALLNSLTESELMLIRETERDQMAGLDEDALVDLHTRIRRARNKYVKLYRREASSRVTEFSSRGVARPKNRRNAGKAELFEDALSRVSRELAAAARRSAAELRTDRRRPRRAPRPAAPPPHDSAPYGRPIRAQHKPVSDDRSHPYIAGGPQTAGVDAGQRRATSGEARQPLTVSSCRRSDHPPLRIPSVTAAPTNAVLPEGLHLNTQWHHSV